MKKSIFGLMILALFISSCSFGEYADKDNEKATTKKVNGNIITYKFTEKQIQNKTFFKVYKLDDKFKIAEYDFKEKTFNSNSIDDANISQGGKYSITETGYIRLVVIDSISYIKAIAEDKDKISLLWTSNKADLNSTKTSKDTYFFKELEKAKEFVK